MKALLLKDLYVLLRQARLFLLLIVVFSLMQESFGSNFAIVYSTLLPMTALAYDEQAHWGRFAAMLPYSRRQLVLSKYLLGGIFVLCSGTLSQLLRVLRGSFDFAAALGQTLVMAGVGVLLLCILLPLMFWLGTERGRLAFYLLVGAGAGLGLLLPKLFLEGESLSLTACWPLLLLALAAVCVVSVLLSCKLYRPR